MKKPFKVEFAPDNKIDSFAYELIEELFGIKGAFLSDESALEDFLDEEDIPGHKLIPFKDIPKEDEDLYEDENPPLGVDKYLVWYPPLTNFEMKKIEKDDRSYLINRIEKVYGISMDDYPKDELLYIWKVARYIKRKLIEN